MLWLLKQFPIGILAALRMPAHSLSWSAAATEGISYRARTLQNIGKHTSETVTLWCSTASFRSLQIFNWIFFCCKTSSIICKRHQASLKFLAKTILHFKLWCNFHLFGCRMSTQNGNEKLLPNAKLINTLLFIDAKWTVHTPRWLPHYFT